MNSNDRIIGGMFGLPETIIPIVSSKTVEWIFLKDSNLFLANARSGIVVLIDKLKPINVWMPSYICSTMIEASIKRKKLNLN